LTQRRSSLNAQVEGRTWVIEDDEEHFAPDVLVRRVVHEGTKEVTCLREGCDYARVAEICRDDDDLLNQLLREREK
jgi:hypothetical protein